MNQHALKRLSSTCNWYRMSIISAFSVKLGSIFQIRDTTLGAQKDTQDGVWRVAKKMDNSRSNVLTFPENLVKQQKKNTSFLYPRDSQTCGDPNKIWDLSTSEKSFTFSFEGKNRNL